MTIATIQLDRLCDATRCVSISVEQYQRMMENGIIDEGAPIELMEGMLVLKDRSEAGGDILTVGREHTWSVKALKEVAESLMPLGYHMQTQAPVIISPFGEPEPDGAILIGTKDDYLRRKPTGDDVTCLIEVADSSLAYDQTTKLRAYAESGVRQYLIVNLVDRCIEEHMEPNRATRRYASRRVLRMGETIELFLRGEDRLTIGVGQWVPPV